MNLTDNEIIKALECSLSNDISKCATCSRRDWCDNLDVDEVINGVLNLIKRLQAENEQLCKRIKSQKKALFEQQSYTAELQAENEELRKENIIATQKRADIFEIVNAYERGRAEALKEFAERFREKASSSVMSCQGYEIYETKQYQMSAVGFDSVLKEMEQKNET